MTTERELKKLERDLEAVQGDVTDLESKTVTASGVKASELGGALVAAQLRMRWLEGQVEQARAENVRRREEGERNNRIAELDKRAAALRDRWGEWNTLYLELGEAVNTLWAEYRAIRAEQGQLARLAGQDDHHLDTALPYNPLVEALRRRRDAPLKWAG